MTLSLVQPESTHTAFGLDLANADGLRIPIRGGAVKNGTVWTTSPNTTLLLNDNATTNVEVNSAGLVTTTINAFGTGTLMLYTIVTASGQITSVTDWRTNSYLNTDVAVKKATVTLTNDQIIALPSTPVVIVPATETLNYTDPITSIPVLLGAVISTDFTDGYSNTDSNSCLVVAFGSDYSLDASMLLEIAGSTFQNAGKRAFFASQTIKGATAGLLNDAVPITGTSTARTTFQDNALALAMVNAGGPLGDGNVANTLTVSVAYYRLDVGA